MDSICILRLSAIGDVTHVLPTVHRLQREWPDLQLTWIIGKLEHRLLSGLPGVDFLVFDKRKGMAAYNALRRELRGRNHDALLHMQLSLRANLAAWLVDADLRVGYDRARSRELHGLRLDRRIEPADTAHVLDALSSFVRPLGLEPDPPRWEIPLADADWAFARRHVDAARKTLVVAPCSSHPRRNWMPERYAAVADQVAARGWQIILAGGPSEAERQMADAISRQMRSEPLDLTGQDTLKQLAATLALADLVVAPDTGPAHIANAMGTPVIGLYAATDPQRSGPYNSLQWCVNRFPEAARRFRNTQSEKLRWGSRIEVPGVMALITVDDVLERFDAWSASQQSLPE